MLRLTDPAAASDARAVVLSQVVAVAHESQNVMLLCSWTAARRRRRILMTFLPSRRAWWR
jgi:hypothetical protein